jgi:hypothetical protein
MNALSPHGLQAGEPRTVALLQEHRGHGVSTAAYYLGRALVDEGLRVLVVDLTGRRTRLQSLLARRPMKNLGLWAPALAKPGYLGELLAQACQQTAGRVDVLLLDADASLLEHAGGLALGMDYVAVVTAATLEGQHAVERMAERLGDAPPPYGKVGVVFSRVSAEEVGELKEQTEQRKLPVIGHYPADYLLAAGDDYSLTGGEPSWPHERYLLAMGRLGRILMRRVPLRRTAAPKGSPATDQKASDTVATSAASAASVAPKAARARGMGARMADAAVHAKAPPTPDLGGGLESHAGT